MPAMELSKEEIAAVQQMRRTKELDAVYSLGYKQGLQYAINRLDESLLSNSVEPYRERVTALRDRLVKEQNK